MRERNDLIANFMSFVVLLFFTAGLQTAFWYFVFPFKAVPTMWIFAFLFVCINREFHIGLMFSYVACLLLNGFTGMPFGILLSSMVSTLVVVSFVRSRIFWPTTSYFTILSAGVQLFWALIFLLFSWLNEPIMAHSLAWWELLVSLLFTPILAPFFFWIGKKIDSIFPIVTKGASEI